MPSSNGLYDKELLTVTDYECAAICVLSDPDYGHYSGGADDEVTLNENTRAFNDYIIRPHCLRDVSSLSTATTFLSHSLPHPIGVAPTAFHGLAHEEGERATVRGAKSASSLMISSSWATTSLEDMRKEAGENPMWMQLFYYTDRELTQSIVRRAEAAGYSALVLTVDYPVRGNRLADKRNHFELPAHLKNANFVAPGSESTVNPVITPITWKDVKELVESTPLPVIVKGILRGDDALEAIRCGVKGIIVSNHGGRQLDSAPATIHALREVVEAVEEGKHRLFRVPVWMDGGIRNGRDVFKALAMGAAGVFVGRPVIWGLAAHGEYGVAHVLNILKEELEQTMKLAGCPTIQSIRDAKDIVVHKSFYERR